MDTITIIVQIISLITGALLNTITCHALLTRRKSLMYCIFLYILLTVFQFFLLFLVAKYLFVDKPLVKYIVLLITCLGIFYYILVFEETFAKKLFTMLGIWMLSITFILISSYFFDGIMYHYIGKYPVYFVKLIKFTLELLLRLFLLFLCISKSKIFKYHLQFFNDKSVFALSLYAFVVLSYSYNNFKIVSNTISISNIGGLFLFVASVVLGYLSVGIALITTNHTLVLNSNIKIAENQLELQRENYKSLIEFIEDSAKSKHDHRHHILALKSMLENNNYESALQYIQKYSQYEMMKDIPVLCMNVTADSLTKYYMSMAMNKGIDFQAMLDIPMDISINSLDLSVILGNCIENSINACDKLDNGEYKYVKLRSDIIGSQLVVIIKNSFNGTVKKAGDEFLSTGHEGYGIGITSVKAAINKYKGRVEINYDNKEFEVNIILPV